MNPLRRPSPRRLATRHRPDRPPPVGAGGGDASMESFFADVAKVKAILEKVRKSLEAAGGASWRARR